MKKMTTVFITILLLLCLPQFLVSQSSGSLDWQIQFLSGRARESVPVNEIIMMENGSEFRLAIRPDSDSYCYLISYDSDRQIEILHNQILKGGTTLNLGPFRINESSGAKIATETVYVIMSLSRQTNLERLIEYFNNNQGSLQYTNNLYREIVRLQNAVSALGEPPSEIITSGGTTRAADDGQGLATKFTGKEIYVRPIAIRH